MLNLKLEQKIIIGIFFILAISWAFFVHPTVNSATMIYFTQFGFSSLLVLLLALDKS